MPSLVGHWTQTDESPEPGEMIFRDDGTMDYIINTPKSQQIMKLVYRIEGDWIISDQPSRPCEARTRFWFESDDGLVLEYGGEQTRFGRTGD